MTKNFEYESSSAYQEAVEMWKCTLEKLMLADPCTPTSILTFFLCDSQQGMFCPLGYDAYERIGEAMRSDGALLSAAEKSGFFASAIPTYMESALTNYGTWECLCEGVSEILHSDVLCRYVPFRTRVLAEDMLRKSTAIKLDESDWCHFSEKAKNTLFGDVWKGY